MKVIRILLALAITVLAIPAQAAAEDEGWSTFGHALTLVQTFVRIAAQSDDPKVSAKAMDDVLSGRNTEANRAFAGLLEEMTAGMPGEYRGRVASIGQDIALMARREAAKAPAEPAVGAASSTERALQARKDLTAMGLRYYDSAQFLDAVRRDDALAVELFLTGRGVNPSSRGGDGRTALDIARANGNEPLAALLAKNLPAER